MTTSITIDAPEKNTVLLTVISDGVTVHEEEFERVGAVDNRLLTAIDTLFQKNILDRLAPIPVKAGKGVDRASILYRIVLTLDAALERSRAQYS
jgi:hypothetical protein